jgi:hypothetical protein
MQTMTMSNSLCPRCDSHDTFRTKMPPLAIVRPPPPQEKEVHQWEESTMHQRCTKPGQQMATRVGQERESDPCLSLPHTLKHIRTTS